MKPKLRHIPLFESIITEKFKEQGLGFELFYNCLAQENVLIIDAQSIINLVLRCYEEAIESNNASEEVLRGHEPKQYLLDNLRIKIDEYDQLYKQEFEAIKISKGMKKEI